MIGTLPKQFLFIICLLFAGMLSPAAVYAQEERAGSHQSHEIAPGSPTEADMQDDAAGERQPKLLVGGYGEVALQRMFYNENILRYSYQDSYRGGKSFGQFDLPHVVFYLSYDFGRGWKMATEIEFEHGGTGSTYEIENSETGEYETEIEKGGEVALEQFWIEKSWRPSVNLRMGHIIVPIGLTNQHHMPTEFFSVLRPEGEMTILPCTWHETGVSFWGRTKNWRYELLFVSGLDAERFGNAGWIADGSTSPYEFKLANSYAAAFRIDNYSVKGLRWAVSGYYGFNTAANSLKREERYLVRYPDLKGEVAIGAFDAVYDDHNVLARANFIYGHLNDADKISTVNKNMQATSPSPRTNVASDAMTWFVEAGYDVMSFFGNRKYKGDKLYVYGHYGFYDSMYKMAGGLLSKGWSERRIISAGINYFPMKGLVIKGEYAMRRLNSPFSNEPTVSLGIGYSGFFKR